jgi:hypothetical protein
VPLSEEELRLLEQMERALVQEDPKLASTLRGTTLRRSARRRAILAGFCFLIGVGVLMAGAILRVTPLGIAGFVIMLASATIGLTAWRGRTAAANDPRPYGDTDLTVIDGGRRFRGRKGSGSGSFLERMEERWQRRRNENGGF